MKTILSLILVILLVSCKKETTSTNPIKTSSINNHTKVGLPYIGGKYFGGTLRYFDKLNNPISIDDSNFEIDVKYLDSFYVNFTITSSLNLPLYFKNFKVKMRILSEAFTNPSNELGWYILDNFMFIDDKIKPIVVNHLVQTQINKSPSAIFFVLQKSNSTSVNGSITSIMLHSEFGESLSISECKRK
jgi:hypothetical protein